MIINVGQYNDHEIIALYQTRNKENNLKSLK